MDTYNPTAISAADVEAVLKRLDRYLRRHGSEYGETPVPGGDFEEARETIVEDWFSMDWPSMELTHYLRNGSMLFGPDLSDLGRHLRAALFCAGRAKRRGWHASGPARRAAHAESRRRDFDDSVGSGMASRAPDPARVAAAVEEAQKRGLAYTPEYQRPKRLRAVKSRNTHGWCIAVYRRTPERTDFEWLPWVRYNFVQCGTTPNRAMPKSRKRIGKETTAAQLREAITG